MAESEVRIVEVGSEAQYWSIGADASLQEVLDSPGCPDLFRQTLTGALSWQVRNRRQVARALVSPTVAPQWSAALLALAATVRVQTSAASSVLEVGVEDLVSRRVQGDPISLQVRLDDLRWGEAHVARTPADEPIVAAIAAVKLNGAGGAVREVRVALTGAWPRPVGLVKAADELVGWPLSRERILAVADAVGHEVEPRGDFLGSEAYRRAMAGVLTRRALEQCLAGGQG